MLLVLGIECTAHTFGIGIIDGDEKKILFSEKSLFKNDLGMDPRVLSDFHTANFNLVLQKARDFLFSINKTFYDLNLISFSQGPGIGNSLKIAGLVAKTLSLKYGVDIIGVNHIRSHLEIGKMLTGFDDPLFLNITGVNSQVIAKDDKGKYKVYGETEDIGLGNVLDSCARLMGLSFPGGPDIEKRALNGKYLFDIPYTIKGMNVSFSGIESYVKQKIREFEKNNGFVKLNVYEKVEFSSFDDLVDNLCFSLQEVVFAMLMEVAERALAYTNKKYFVLVGGVAANRRFVDMAKKMCKLRDVIYDSIDLKYCMDNGAMIAVCGLHEINRAKKAGDISNLKPRPYITIETDL